MTSVTPKKTPTSRADWRLSNFVLEGGRSKRPDGKYVTRSEKDGRAVGKSEPSAPHSNGKKGE